MTTERKIVLCDGKYTFQQIDTAYLRVLRYGEPWREFDFDNALLALFDYAYKEELPIVEVHHGEM